MIRKLLQQTGKPQGFWGRVLRPGGRFLPACEMGESSDTTDLIDGLTICSGEELKGRLEAAGFIHVKLNKTRRVWFCLTAEKASPAGTGG